MVLFLTSIGITLASVIINFFLNERKPWNTVLFWLGIVGLLVSTFQFYSETIQSQKLQTQVAVLLSQTQPNFTVTFTMPMNVSIQDGKLSSQFTALVKSPIDLTGKYVSLNLPSSLGSYCSPETPWYHSQFLSTFTWLKTYNCTTTEMISSDTSMFTLSVQSL